MSQVNVEIVMSLFEDSGADVAQMYRDDEKWAVLTKATASLFHPRFESVRPGLPGGRTYIGADGIRNAWLDWLAPWEAYRVEIEDAIDCGERVLLLVNNFGRIAGSSEEVRSATAGVYTLHDGQIVRWEIYSDRSDALKAVGLEE